MIIDFIHYYEELAQSQTCPGIARASIITAAGVDPWLDCEVGTTFRKMFDTDVIVYIYDTSQHLDEATAHYNQHVDVTDSWCMYMDPHNPADANILQPPAPCVIIQSYSQLQHMRQQ
jgi:hypothetical protein